MAQPIYKLFMAKPSQAGYQVAQEEQEKVFAKVEEALEQVGGKRVISCDSGWASEQWTFWGVEEFPDVEAVQKYTALLNELNWFQYVDSFTLLGTKSQPDS
jgi:hypothetical protein